MCLTPPPIPQPKRRRNGRRGAGQKYEQDVHAYLHSLYGNAYIPSLWFEFRENGRYRTRFCQTDGILFDLYNRRLTIVEVKLQHTVDAWWQLRHLYLPVLTKVFPPDLWEYAIVEVVRWYDKAVAFPEPVKLVGDIQSLACGEFGVHIWNA